MCQARGHLRPRFLGVRGPHGPLSRRFQHSTLSFPCTVVLTRSSVRARSTADRYGNKTCAALRTAFVAKSQVHGLRTLDRVDEAVPTDALK